MNWPLLHNTLLVGVGSTFVAMIFGVIAALVLSSAGRFLGKVLIGLSLVTLALPPFLVTNTWMHYLGEAGAWRNWMPLDVFTPAGAVLILSLWLWPISAIVVWGAWQRLESVHLEVEPHLRGWALIRFLLLPMARGALVVVGLITFVLAGNNLTVPALLQVNVYPAEVWLSFSSTFWVDVQGEFDWIKAASLSWPLVALPLLLGFALRKRAFPWPTLRGRSSPELFRRALGPAWLVVTWTLTGLLLALSAGLPLWQIAGNTQTWAQLPNAMAAGRSAILNSAWISVVVASFCVALAVFNVLPVARRRRRASAAPASTRQLQGRPVRTVGRRVVGGTLLWLPFLVPGVLIGIALIQLLNRPVTAWFYQSLGVVILALTVRYLAIGWSISRYAVNSADPDLTDAAWLEGASGWQLFRFVLWPQIAPQLAVAWCIVFLLCLWDVETLVLIVPPGGETMALRVFNLLHYGHTAHVNALCLVLLALAVAPLLLVAALVKARTLLVRRPTVRVLTNAATIALALLLTGCSPGIAPDEARVNSQFFDRVEIIATRGVAPGQVNKPRSVTVDHDDNLFVLDFTGRVQKFSPEGEFLLYWQMPETERGNPKGLSVDRDGNIIVVEPHYSRVNLFTPDGELLMQWGVQGTNDGQFSFPRAAVVNSKGEWFVSEFGVVDRVQRFAFNRGRRPSLQFLVTYGQAGDARGEFNRAEGLFVDAHDRLFVADAVNHRVQVLDAGGRFLWEFGHAGSAAGELSYPYDVCVDRAGQIFVCEFGNSRIQVFDADGQSLEIIGGSGAAPGLFNNPWGLALDSKGNLYVADSQNHRVQKLVRKAEVRLRSAEVRRPDLNTASHGPSLISNHQSPIANRQS